MDKACRLKLVIWHVETQAKPAAKFTSHVYLICVKTKIQPMRIHTRFSYDLRLRVSTVAPDTFLNLSNHEMEGHLDFED